MQDILKKIFVSVVCLLLTACTVLKPVKIPDNHYYLLNQLPDQIRTAAHRQQKTVLVLSPLAHFGLNSRQITYSKVPYRIQHYHDGAWAVLPTEMIRSVIAKTLEETKAFHAILEQPELAKAHYRLSSRLIQFRYEQFSHQVHVALQVYLINNHSSEVMASQRFSQLVSVSDESSLDDLVVAFNHAIASIAFSISQFVVHHV